MKRASQVIAVVTLAAAMVWGYRVLFPSDERLIRRELANLVESANSLAGEEGLGRIATAAQLGRHFTDTVVLDLGRRYGHLEGRESLIAFAARGWQPDWHVGIDGVRVTITEKGRTARALVTVTFTRTAPDSGRELDARDFTLDLLRVNDRWLISRVEAMGGDEGGAEGQKSESDVARTSENDV